MSKAVGHILKPGNVKLEGRFYLDVAQAQPGLLKGKNAVSATAQVRIVENHPEFAVIEVSCFCGAKILLRCDYAGGQSPVEGSQTQKTNLSETSDQTK